MQATKTYREQVNFWHWGQLFVLSNLVDEARHYCLELIKKGHSKLQCNKALQGQFKLNKRWANSIYTEVASLISNVKTLTGSPKWAVGYSAVSLRFYFKNSSWYVAVTTDVNQPEITSEYLSGYVGIDLNADSMGWAVCDSQGNLLEFGDYALDLHSKSSNQREAILAGAARFVVLKAKEYNFPIAREELDFQKKKTQLKEKGEKYARMLSTPAYSAFNEASDNACIKHGVYHKKVNPAYSSSIGMTKFMSMYGMNSSSSAAFVIARRGRRFSERLPKQHHLLPSKSAYPNGKHVWSHWSKVCKNVLGIPRHQYFTDRLNRTQKVMCKKKP